MSRAPSPAGVAPASTIADQSDAAARHGRRSRSLARRCSRCRRRRIRRRPTRSGRRGSGRPPRPRARSRSSDRPRLGPCTASTARSCVMSVTADARRAHDRCWRRWASRRTRAGRPPSSGCHHTMMSSSTDAVGVVEQVRVLGAPRADLGEIVGQRALQPVEGVVAGDSDRAQMRHVEDRRRAAAGHVLVDRARVLERHVPAAERHDPGAELAVNRVERRDAASSGIAAQRTAETSSPSTLG